MLTLPGGLKVSDKFSVNLLEIETLNDFLLAFFYIGLFNLFIYFGIGTLLEFTNPVPKTEFRRKMMKK